jgi:hypothetical protein
MPKQHAPQEMNGIEWLCLSFLIIPVMFVAQCGSCLGIDYWQPKPDPIDPATQEYRQRRNDALKRTQCHSAANTYKCLKAHGWE